MNLGAFAIASLIGKETADGEEGYSLYAYSGLPAAARHRGADDHLHSSRSPAFRRWRFLGSSSSSGQRWKGSSTCFALSACVNSVIGACYYLRVVVHMYMEGNRAPPPPARAILRRDPFLTFSTIATILLGLQSGLVPESDQVPALRPLAPPDAAIGPVLQGCKLALTGNANQRTKMKASQADGPRAHRADTPGLGPMHRSRAFLLSFLSILAATIVAADTAQTRELAFRERVEAQRAHRARLLRSPDQRVTVLRGGGSPVPAGRKVATYLEQSAALERF
jgi:hypothetical protein